MVNPKTTNVGLIPLENSPKRKLLNILHSSKHKKTTPIPNAIEIAQDNKIRNLFSLYSFITMHI